MTPLPDIPENLRPSLPSVPNLAPQVPQFPNLPSVAGVNAISSVSAQFGGLTSANPLIKAAIPESILDDLIEKAKETDGSVDFNEVTTKINAKVNSFISASTVTKIELPTLPSLIPKLPVIDIPTPAEIRAYVNTLIQQRKIEAQQLVTETQLREAEAELKPFSNRKTKQNDSARLGINVSTFIRNA
jgi:hypothetical protein